MANDCSPNSCFGSAEPHFFKRTRHLPGQLIRRYRVISRDIQYTLMHRNHSMFAMRYIELIQCFEKLWIMRCIDVFS